jgi:hypothetical protein
LGTAEVGLGFSGQPGRTDGQMGFAFRVATVQLMPSLTKPAPCSNLSDRTSGEAREGESKNPSGKSGEDVIGMKSTSTLWIEKIFINLIHMAT